MEHLDFLTNLPQELVMEILSKLPIPNIIQCKSVCKPWLNLIESDQNFAKFHLSKSVPGLAVGHRFYEFVQEFDYHQHCSLVCKFSFPYHAQILSSVNGLLFMTAGLREEYHLYICNPITRDYIMLPPPPLEFYDKPTFGFGVSNISGEYKVVVISKSSVPCKCHVYTLGTGSWRSVSGCPSTIIYERNDVGAFVNGNLHWMTSEDRICCLDLDTELFQTFQSPRSYYVKLSVLDDCLCLCENYVHAVDGDGIEIWLLEKYEDESSWTMKLSCKVWGVHLPIKVFKDGDFLMSEEDAMNYTRLVCYSKKTTSFRAAGVFDRQDGGLDIWGSQSSNVIYTPSFLSLKIFAMENPASY